TADSRRALIEHLRVHTGNRAFLCPADGCGRVYKRSDFLAKHIRSHDTESQPKGTDALSRRRPRAASDTDSDASMYSSHDEQLDALELDSQLAYIRDLVTARQAQLRRYKAKIRRLRLENDILVDSLAQI
ncbi:hypothetical protein IWW55_001428, partial [Coemansia sp. RSA 2706]